MHDVVGILGFEPLRSGDGEDESGVEVEEPLPRRLVLGVCDRPQHAGARRFVVEVPVGHGRASTSCKSLGMSYEEGPSEEEGSLLKMDSHSLLMPMRL